MAKATGATPITTILLFALLPSFPASVLCQPLVPGSAAASPRAPHQETYPTYPTVPGEGAENETYTWQATNFALGCGSAACGLGFDVKADAGYVEGAPCFDVKCGAPYGAGWIQCRPNSEGEEYEEQSSIQAVWDTTNGSAAPYKVNVSHIWPDEQAGGQFKALGTGSSEGGDGGAAFEIKVKVTKEE